MVYLPLDKAQNLIRLLHLAPAAGDNDEIKCTLSFPSVDEANEYEALSYAWGTFEESELLPINLDGKDEFITPNLHLALANLRHKDRQRILWIDAVCIDQSNLSERNHQVSLMSSIYDNASLVVLWLGELTTDMAMTMDIFERIRENGKLHLNPLRSPNIISIGAEYSLTKVCELMIQFFDSPCWHRV
jgi:hypothetical protein